MELAIVVAVVALAACLLIWRRPAPDLAAERRPVEDARARYLRDLESAQDEASRSVVVRAEAKRVLDEASRDPMQVSYEAVDQFIGKHIDTLWAKKRQLTYTDDYGVENASRFEGEIDYFISNVLPRHLIEDYMDTVPGLYDDPYTCAKTIIREKLKWHNRTMNRRMDEAKARGEAEQQDLQYHPACSGAEFEQLVKANLEAKGYSVRTTPASGDQGVDLLAAVGDKTVAVQCKRSGSPIGNKAIQEVAAGRVHYGADEAWVISDADFTTSARRLAQTNDVKLMNFFAL